jgi:hypothetical protein
MTTIRRTSVALAAVVAAVLGTVVAVAPRATAANTASISGTVREAGTAAPVAGASVDLYREITRTLGPPFGNGKPFKTYGYVTSVQSGADGTYTLSGLPASDAAGYWVCFGTFGIPYEPECYLDELGYNPFPNPLGLVDVPPNASRVHVGAGQHVGRIDASLVDFAVLNQATAGTIAGKVTQTVLGLPLKQVRVTVYNTSGRVVTEAMTAANGAYRLVFVAAGPGYRVCFDGSGARGGVSLHGYVSRCRLVPVTVAPGTTTGNVNATLSGSL